MEQETSLSLPNAGVPDRVNPFCQAFEALKTAVFALSASAAFGGTLIDTEVKFAWSARLGSFVKNPANTLAESP